jgi:hypothetical protein
MTPVSEACAIEIPHESLGEAIDAAVAPRPQLTNDKPVTQKPSMR